MRDDKKNQLIYSDNIRTTYDHAHTETSDSIEQTRLPAFHCRLIPHKKNTHARHVPTAFDSQMREYRATRCESTIASSSPVGVLCSKMHAIQYAQC